MYNALYKRSATEKIVYADKMTPDFLSLCYIFSQAAGRILHVL